MFDSLALYCIFNDAMRYTALSGRNNVHQKDILFAIKRYKSGYDNFEIPTYVLAVYESVFIPRRLPVFKNIVDKL